MAHLSLALLPLLFAAPPAAVATEGTDEAVVEAALEKIETDEIEVHVRYLASRALEGRDSPSTGLDRAAQYLCERFAEAGLVYAPRCAERWAAESQAPMPAWSQAGEADGTFLWPYRIGELPGGGREGFQFTRPVPDACSLELLVEGEPAREFAYGEDFVPLRGCDGDVRGELVFAGFAISSKTEKYDDFKRLDVADKVALVFEGEPEHAKKFDGEEVTDEASLWRKLHLLHEQRARGALIVRRTAPPVEGDAHPRLGFRYTLAFFQGSRPERQREVVPALEISMECATALLGQDAEKLLEKLDRSARPTLVKDAVARQVSFRGATEAGGVVVHNVVGLVPGSDAALAAEYVVVGAHYDHIGVGVRGRIGLGADDNASGTAALLAIARALREAAPRRSVLVVAFASEEDGLIGSRRFVEDLPVPAGKVAGMINLDMIGRGKASVVTLLGGGPNPDMAEAVKRAKRIAKTGISKLEFDDDPGLFQRSDQYSFHEAGIPSIFFMEDMPIAVNKEYHTWMDTPDLVDMQKVANTARLAFTTAWILANDDGRPAPPHD